MSSNVLVRILDWAQDPSVSRSKRESRENYLAGVVFFIFLFYIIFLVSLAIVVSPWTLVVTLTIPVVVIFAIWTAYVLADE